VFYKSCDIFLQCVDLVGKKMADIVEFMSVAAFAEYLQNRFDEDVDIMKSNKIS